MASLASSLGWKFMTPSGIQRREKFTHLADEGHQHHHQQHEGQQEHQRGMARSQKATGICATASAHTRPMPIENRWRVRK
jgi:hypothetical protein